MDEFKFKTIFASNIKVINPDEESKNEAFASLAYLKDLLPDDINPEEEPDLLFIAGNLAVAGMVNLNDDGLDISTALATYKKFEKKQVNIEHNRKQITGYIIKAGLSEFGTDRVISEEEARVSGKPFNIATVAVLWKVANKELCNYILEASNPLHPDYKSLSLSFEMGFNDYSIISLPEGEKEIAKASKVITSDSEEFSSWSKCLRANKGNGMSPHSDLEKVYRIMPDTVIPLGQGIVSVPAAAVKGIIAITEPIEEQEESPEEEKTETPKEEAEESIVPVGNPPIKTLEKPVISFAECKNLFNTFLSILEKRTSTNIIFAKLSVSDITEKYTNSFHNMNKADLNKIKEQISSMEKPEDFKTAIASAVLIADAIAAESEKIADAKKAAEDRAAEFEKAKQEAQAAHEKLATEFASLQKELSEIRAQQQAEAAEKAFNERMASIDEVFDFDDEEKSIVVAEVRDLDSAGFEKWMAKAKKMMKEKTKQAKKDKEADDKKKADEMKAALAAKGVTVTIDEKTLNFKEIIAAAQENVVSAPVHNVVETKTPSLADLAKEAFADMTIGGKKTNELSKKE